MMHKVPRIVDALYLAPYRRPSTKFKIVYTNSYHGDGGGGCDCGTLRMLKMLGGGRKCR